MFKETRTKQAEVSRTGLASLDPVIRKPELPMKPCRAGRRADWASRASAAVFVVVAEPGRGVSKELRSVPHAVNAGGWRPWGSLRPQLPYCTACVGPSHLFPVSCGNSHGSQLPRHIGF